MRDKISTKNIDRDCVVCGKDIKISLSKNGRYFGGHYFGKLLENEEYWECEGCYKTD